MMKTFWKKTGWFGMCVLVLVVSIVLQLIASVAGQIPITFAAGFQAASQGITDVELIQQIAYDAIMDNMSLILLFTHLLLLLAFGLWYRLGCIRRMPRKQSLKQSLSGRNILVILMVALGMCFFVNFGMSVLYPLIPSSIMEAYEEMMQSAGIGEDPLAIFAAVCIAPIGEELIYRGTCMYYANRLTEDMPDRRKAFWVANCIQALGFGVFHFNIIQGSYAFLLGLALGYLCRKCGSILASMLAHALINAASSFLWEPVANLLPESYILYSVCALVMLAVAIAGMRIGGPAVERISENVT